jgi:hypothetical protein
MTFQNDPLSTCIVSIIFDCKTFWLDAILRCDVGLCVGCFLAVVAVSKWQPGITPADGYGRVGLDKENLYTKFQILNRLSRG